MKKKKYDLETMRDTALEFIEEDMPLRLVMSRLLDASLDEKQRLSTFIHPPQIRTIKEMLTLMEMEEWPNLRKFRETLAWELAVMALYAARAKEPSIVLSAGRTTGDQHIYEFSVSDLAKPEEDEFNWHGQNTSQWCYAGCILIQNREISTHH